MVLPIIHFQLPSPLLPPASLPPQTHSYASTTGELFRQKELIVCADGGSCLLVSQLGLGYIVLIIPGRREPERELLLLQLAFCELSYS